MTDHTPHSTPGANQVLLRDLLEVMQACHDNTCADCKADLVTALKAFSYLEEQLDTTARRLAEVTVLVELLPLEDYRFRAFAQWMDDNEKGEN